MISITTRFWLFGPLYLYILLPLNQKGILIPVDTKKFVFFRIGSGFFVCILQIDALLSWYVEVEVFVLKFSTASALGEMHMDGSSITWTFGLLKCEFRSAFMMGDLRRNVTLYARYPGCLSCVSNWPNISIIS